MEIGQEDWRSIHTCMISFAKERDGYIYIYVCMHVCMERDSI